MKLRPGSLAGDTGYRALLALAAARIGRDREAEAAVATALRTTALGRIPPAERAWLARIAAHRRALAADGIVANAAADPRNLATDERAREAAAACLWMSLPPLLGSLLMRLVRELRPDSCLELGTGFGISAAYQAAGLRLNGSGTMLTLDVADMVGIAEPALAAIDLADRVELRGGMIEDTLADAVAAAAPIGFAVLDADHTEAGTMAAFEGLLPGLADPAVLVFDDINWTEEMGAAWSTVRAHERVRSAVSVRRLGIAVVEAAG